MSSEIRIYTEDVAEQKEYAKTLAASQMIPAAYRGHPANVFVAVQAGQALGIAPIQAIQQINVINGKPSLSAELMAALVMKAGHKIRITATDERAEVVIIRADDPGHTPPPIVWTMERAKRAGLLSNPSWTKYPAAMLRSRAVSEACRTWAPDAIAGFSYTPEEVETFTTPDDTNTPGGAGPVVADAEIVDETPSDADAALGEFKEALAAAVNAGMSDTQLSSVASWASRQRTDDIDALNGGAEWGRAAMTLSNYVAKQMEGDGK